MSLDTHGLEELEHLAASNASMFLPKVLEPVKQDGRHFQAYRTVSLADPPQERLYALHQANLTFAKNAQLSPTSILDFVAGRVSMSIMRWLF